MKQNIKSFTTPALSPANGISLYCSGCGGCCCSLPHTRHF